MSTRKHPNISILSIRERFCPADWIAFLTNYYNKRDIIGLGKALYGIQADMSDLTKQGMNDASLVNFFIRLQRSIEDTARRILKLKYPSPLDNIANNLDVKKRLAIKNNCQGLSEIESAQKDFKAHELIKKRRDAEFNQFIKDSSF